MPKIKDLGIKVIPETMRPPEIGGGGCGCTALSECGQFSLGCGAHSFGPLCGAHSFALPCGAHTTQYFCIPTLCLCTVMGTWCGPLPCLGTCGWSPYAGGQPQGPFTREQIAALKEAMQEQIAALDEMAKSAGPRTTEEIAAREKQLNEELEYLKSRRKDLEKKK